ncbi:hypothetical protein Vafri_11032 [Volvox africanus]|uniref:Reverse transcriptase domain-containing protein n=2 Tax=Volvox africanus TaxID=51714 RepID=A0A8J4BBT3_9CHLO|nr:hypothetical protein Vafri_11032 [Volvox africanus]
MAELRTALMKSQPGKAPGWDGIPSDLYRKFWPAIGQTMARLFTAIGSTGQVPHGFLEGVIKILYKKGDPKQPGNYRPITLLCSDYRLLAKVLANRLGPALGRIISPEQSAFLPKRHIGSNILFLRHLPHLLRKQNRRGILAFLDFAKAYDTVDREFLLSAMEAMGVGPQFYSWTQLLLSNTQARAMINGFRSRRVKMEAGVRQGCPLAPPLYLFVGQALLSWLKSQDVGIRLLQTDIDRVTACQFADDAEAVLEGEASVPTFLEAMETFARASGQRLNRDKVELLRIGATDHEAQPSMPTNQGQQQPQPTTISGLKVVATATALNLPMDNQPQPPQLDWPKMLGLAYRRMQSLARFPLSAFGRAKAASAYGLQTVTWHMEHGGPPPAPMLAQIERLTARLVDRKQGPEDQGQRLTGVPNGLLIGHPSAGGFGLLPLRQHTQARHAVWAVRFIQGAMESGDLHPWVRTLATYLELTHPALQPWALTTAKSTGPWIGEENLPEDISRIVGALGYLPPPDDICDPPLTPGDWCWAAALWGNPLLPNNNTGGNGNNTYRRPGLEAHHTVLATCKKLLTVGDLVRVYDMLEHGQGTNLQDAEWIEWIYQHLDPSNMSNLQREKEATHTAITALYADINPIWLEAARSVETRKQEEDRQQHEQRVHPLPDRKTVMAMIIRRLGWRLPGSSSTVPIYGLTVRQATQLQNGPALEQRQQLMTAFVQEARGVVGATAHIDPENEVNRFHTTLARLWSDVRWENKNKETLWRLAVDGVPLPGNTHLSRMPPQPCGCGTLGGPNSPPSSPRLHHFWECPIAQAVRDQIDRHLPISATTEGGMGRHHLWLIQAPPGCDQAPWDVIAMAALSSMEHGRHCLRAAIRGQRQMETMDPRQPPPSPQPQTRVEQGPRQRVITDFFRQSGSPLVQEEEANDTQPAGTSLLQPTIGGRMQMVATTAAASSPLHRARVRAVADFWARLHSFAALGIPRRGWDRVGPQHPILAVAGGQVQCAAPIALTD